MKPVTVSLVALALGASSSFAQKPGDPVTTEALGKLEWIQGSAPAAWEPGKLYLLECWATWCGPCIAAIPHVDALHDKYESQGLRVIGVNVWEDGKDKVTAFVKKKGDGMSYPVAYTGKGGAFETGWLKPAEVTGIPRAFVVKDGKVLATTHPARLTDELVESLLKGGEAEQRAVATLAEAQESRKRTVSAIGEIRAALMTGDLATAEVKLKALTGSEPDNRALPLTWILFHMAKEEWETASAKLAGISDVGARNLTAFNVTLSPALLEKAPPVFLTQVADGFEAMTSDGGSPGNWLLASRLRWRSGAKEKALAAAERALAAAESEKFRGQGLAEPFRRLVESVKAGEMPDDETFGTWVKEARGEAAE